MDLEKVSVSSICDVQTGKRNANHAEEEGEYEFYTCADKPLKANTYSFEGPAIILPGNGANVGLSLYSEDKFEAYQRTYVLNNFENALPKYVYYHFINSWEWFNELQQYGSATNYIKMGNFDDFKIPLPPLETQKKIAGVLDKADALRQKRRQTIEKLDALTQSVFLDMFGDPLVNSKSFPTKKTSEVVNVNPRKPRNLEADDEELISFLPMDAVSETGSRFDYEKKRPFKDVNSGYTFFKKGDVLLAKITPCLENGKSCIAKIETDFGFGSTEFHVFEPNDKLIAEYLYYAISNNNFLKAAEEKMTGSAGQKRVPTSWVKNIELPVPPIEMQNNFREKVLKLQLQGEKYKLSKQELDNLFNALLQKAFKGELHFSESEEPLLAAEKAAEYSAG